MLDRKSGELLCEIVRMAGEKERAVFIHEAAQRMGLGMPAASRLTGMLSEAGLLRLMRYGCVMPTEEGFSAASGIQHRRRIVSAFLAAASGRNPEETAEECARIEYLLGDDTVKGLERILLEGIRLPPTAEIHMEKAHNGGGACIDMP
ncbi:MAG: hypothetical protein IJC71_02245 [Clostridia bacterium]|nr:hypothetical protein [Clostridia bacterium]